MIDRILIGTNDNPEYYPFIEIVSKAWKKFFPDAKLTIGYVSDTFPHKEYLSQHCDSLFCFQQIEGIPTQNQSKVVRPLMAQKFSDEVCMFSDLDLIPLQQDYFINASDKVTESNYICCGFDAQCYQAQPDIGKSPICFMLGTGKTIKEIVNPNNYNFEQWVNQWKGFKQYDTKEDISKLPFSDESLMRVLLNRWQPKGLNSPRVVKVKRGWTANQAHHRLDRVGWKGLDKQKLFNGGYIDSHMLKPYNKNNDQFKILNEYLES